MYLTNLHETKNLNAYVQRFYNIHDQCLQNFDMYSTISKLRYSIHYNYSY